MTKEETFVINVGGFFVGSASVPWMILTSPRYGFKSVWPLDTLMSLPVWSGLMVIASLVLLAVGRGKYAVGLFVGAALTLALLFILAWSVLLTGG